MPSLLLWVMELYVLYLSRRFSFLAMSTLNGWRPLKAYHQAGMKHDLNGLIYVRLHSGQRILPLHFCGDHYWVGFDWANLSLNNQCKRWACTECTYWYVGAQMMSRIPWVKPSGKNWKCVYWENGQAMQHCDSSSTEGAAVRWQCGNALDSGSTRIPLSRY